MKKNELVHLHALLTCVAGDFVERGVVDAEAFSEYRALGVSSRSLRASRADHEAAVRLLVDVLATAAEEAGGANCEATDGRLSPR